MVSKSPGPVCDWLSLREALSRFVRAGDGTQGQQHILPMHWYVASRLVLEGGFDPDWIVPRPPFVVVPRGREKVLHYEPESAGGGEATVFGGLKTKDVDVVVIVPRLGPCLAVSMKGTLNAFRNLTNRLEEAVGDCTNLHISYPALVYGFLHLLRANRPGPLPPDSSFLEPDAAGQLQKKDIAIAADGSVSDFVGNYAQAIARLGGRRDLRDDVSRYEAVSLVMANPYLDTDNRIDSSFPPADSPLHFGAFFRSLYQQYDLRFVYGAANLRSKTRRSAWAIDSPVVENEVTGDYVLRLGDAED